MAIRIRFQYPTGASLGYSIERLSDGLYYDFAASGATAGTFTASPTTMVSALTAETGSLSGRYRAVLTPTPAGQFVDGEYCVTLHDLNRSNAVAGVLSVTMRGGDDAPAFPSNTTGADVWSMPLPGSFADGTAGALLGRRLDAAISSRLASAGYVAAPSPSAIAAAVWDEPSAGHTLAGSFGSRLDATVSSRYDGQGAVPGVASAVTVGLNLDKTGYTLGAEGLDAVSIEPGVNARQALVPILAAAAGEVTGGEPGPSSITIKGGNSSTTRILATTDSSGNRTAVTLVLPN